MKKRIAVLLVVAVIILVIEVVIGAIIVNRENSYSGSCRGGQLDPFAVEAHNSMLDSYIDKTVKGKLIKELCSKIANYNQSADSGYIVGIIYKSNENVTDENAIVLVEGKENNINNISEHIKANVDYKVTGEYTPRTGIINQIIITQDDI